MSPSSWAVPMRISTSVNQLSLITDLGCAGKKTPSIVGVIGLLPSILYLNSFSWATKRFSTSVFLRHFMTLMVSLLTSEGPHPAMLMNVPATFVDLSAVEKLHGALMVPLCTMALRNKCRLIGDNKWELMDAAPAEWPNSVKEFGSQNLTQIILGL